VEAANKYERAICVMYDLSGMKPGEEGLLLKDIAEIARQYSIKDHVKNPSYLYHNGNRWLPYGELDLMITDVMG
jgi:hypothetical protein